MAATRTTSAITIATISTRQASSLPLTAGHVIDLGGGTSGPKLDLRGAIGYTHNEGDRFTNISADQQKYTFSTWTGTAGLTLFSNMTLQGGALLRPYIQGYVRQEWGYDNKLDFVLVGSPPDVNHYDQAHSYGGVTEASPTPKAIRPSAPRSTTKRQAASAPSAAAWV